MDNEVFVQNIKNHCKRLGIPPTNACKNAGVGASFISDINRGQTPSVSKVQMLANYLGVTTSDLLGEKKEPTTVSGDGQIEKLSALLREYGIDVDGLTEPELLKLAKVIAAVLKG